MFLCQGPYGPYVQMGMLGADGKKPKRVSLPKSLPPEQLTPAIAEKLLSLPRELGAHPESGKKVSANIGRFGPYVQHDKDFRSVPKSDSVLEIGLARALELLAQPKGAARRGAPAGKVLGPHPADAQPVTLHDGRYGPYVKHGAHNASLPKGTNAAAITLDEALTLLAAKQSGAASGKQSATRPKRAAAAGKSRKAA